MTKLQEAIDAAVAKGIADARATFTADVEDKLKSLSKDAIASREGVETDEKDRIKSFYKALASGDRAEMKAVQGEIAKDYKAKGQTVGTDNQGGILVPVTVSQSIQDKLEYVSPMRRIATVINNMPAKLVLNSGSLPTTYWVAEGAPITESGVTFAQATLEPHKAAGLDKFTSEVLEDAAINPSIQNYVEDCFVLSLALLENAAFVNGDGSGKPYGFRSSAITPLSVAQASTALAYGDLVALKYKLSTAYRETGVYVMPSAAIQNIEVQAAAYPYYRESIAVDATATLLGRPVYIVDEIPANLGTGTNETEIWYGNFKQYFIGDRGGLRVDLGTDAERVLAVTSYLSVLSNELLVCQLATTTSQN